MAEFQSVLGVILLVSSIVIIALAVYNLVIISKAKTNIDDSRNVLTDGEKKGAQGTGIVTIIIALVIGVYGVVLLLPEERAPKGAPTLRTSRSLAGSVLNPGNQYL